MLERLVLAVGLAGLLACGDGGKPDEAMDDAGGSGSPAPADAGSDAARADGGRTLVPEDSGSHAPAAQPDARTIDEPKPDALVEDPCADDDEGPTLRVTPPSPITIAAGGEGAAVIQLEFSEPVTGVEAALDAESYVSSVDSFESSYVVTVAGLAFGQSLQLRIERDAITDLCGNALASDVVIDLAVQADPCDADVDAPRMRSFPSSPIELLPSTARTEIDLLWNEPVEGLSALTVSGSAVASLSGSGQEYVLEITGLPAGTTTVSIPPSVTDRCGNAFGGAMLSVQVLAVESTAPSVASTSPVSGAQDVPSSSLIVIRFDEPMDRSAGIVSLRVGQVDLAFVTSWSTSDQELTLVPLDALPVASTIDVGLSGFRDKAGNALASSQALSFTTASDPCAGLPFRVEVDDRLQLVQAGGTATVALELSGPFPLRADMFELEPGSGSGTLDEGTLAGTGASFTVDLTGATAGDTYQIHVDRSTTIDGCTTLEAAVVEVRVRVPTPSSGADCPLPAPLAQHVPADDACDEGTNHDLSIAQDTGVALADLGDAFSFGGAYDADVINGQDTDYFAFEVVEDGAYATDLQVVIAYGCSFSGQGARPPSAPVLQLFDETGRLLDRVVAQDFYADVEGAGAYGYGAGTLSVAGLTGTNRYILSLDDGAVNVTDLCVTYIAYVELVDNTRPGSCQPLEPETHVDGTPQPIVRSQVTNQARVVLVLDQPFAITEGDISIVPTSGGAGTLAAGSLDGNGSRWYVSIANVQDGETYDVVIAERAGTCGTLRAGFLPVTVTSTVPDNLPCPLPPPLPQHFGHPDLCFAPPTNGALVDSSPTGFVLSDEGDEFSVGGFFDSSDPANTMSYPDFFRFAIEEDGAHLTELELTLAYGCEITGTGNLLIWAPEVAVLDAAGTNLGAVRGEDTQAQVAPSPNTGFGRGRVRVGSPTAGQNVYHLRFSSLGISQRCMDYVVYAELVDNDVDLVCLGAGATSLVSGTRALVGAASPLTVPITLSARFVLQESDLTLSTVSGSGTGTLVPQSLGGSGRDWTVQIENAVAGDVYRLRVAPRTDQCGTAQAGGDILVIVTGLPTVGSVCPLPPTATNHLAAPDGCGQNTNGTVATSAATGFTLTNVGDGFSVGGLYESNTTPDTDFFGFNLVADGVSDYLVAVSLVYGCTFTGSPGAGRPLLDLVTTSNVRITGMTGAQNYNAVSGTGSYAGSAQLFVIPAASAPAGLRTYHFRLDDNHTSTFCMDYAFYVQLAARTP